MSSALAQAELFEAPARRRLIVPAGCGSVWGVDPSTRRVAVGTVRTEDGEPHRRVRQAAFPAVSGPARLAAMFRESRALAADLAAVEAPGLILFEQPSGRVINHELEYACGVIQAAVYEGVTSVLGAAPRMESITSSAWKKLACGRGDIRKPKRGDGSEYAVLTWARLNGYPGASWDEADALAIAEAGRRDWILEER